MSPRHEEPVWMGHTGGITCIIALEGGRVVTGKGELVRGIQEDCIAQAGEKGKGGCS